MAVTAPMAQYRQLSRKSTTALSPRIINVHTMVWDLLSCERYFGTLGNPYSHFGTGFDGHSWTSFQWQDLRYRAASDYHGNPFCISIENADKGPGFPVWSGSNVPRFVPEQAEILAQLIAWLCARFAIPPYLVSDSLPGRVGPSYHRLGIDPWRVPNGVLYSSSRGKVCPGDRRIAQLRDEIMPRVRQILTPVPTPPPPPESDDMTKLRITAVSDDPRGVWVGIEGQYWTWIRSPEAVGVLVWNGDAYMNVVNGQPTPFTITGHQLREAYWMAPNTDNPWTAKDESNVLAELDMDSTFDIPGKGTMTFRQVIQEIYGAELAV